VVTVNYSDFVSAFIACLSLYKCIYFFIYVVIFYSDNSRIPFDVVVCFQMLDFLDLYDVLFSLHSPENIPSFILFFGLFNVCFVLLFTQLHTIYGLTVDLYLLFPQNQTK